MHRTRRLVPALGFALVQIACASSGTIGSRGPLPSGYPPPESGTPASASAGDASRPIVPRDLLDVTVFEAPELSRSMRVSDDGTISMPLLGPVRAAGRSARELEVVLQDTLRSSYMRDPRVLVELKERAPQPIYVVGEVNQPGAFVPSGSDQLTVLRAVAVARGAKPSAAAGRAIVLRPVPDKEPIHIPVNLNAVMKGEAPDLTLLPNDIVYVPKHTERAIAIGVVDALIRVVTFRAVF